MGLTRERLLECLDYNPLTGVFLWKKRLSRCVRIGDIAGRVNEHGHRYIGLDGDSYAAHRLAWLYVYGEWPKKPLDHIEGMENRIDNLREATTAENACNRGKQKNNTSGYKGVSWQKAAKKWGAYIGVGGRLQYLGLFTSKEEAHEAYCAAAKRLHGEFARAA